MDETRDRGKIESSLPRFGSRFIFSLIAFSIVLASACRIAAAPFPSWRQTNGSPYTPVSGWIEDAAASPDGAFVYVCAGVRTPGFLAVYARRKRGELAFLQVVEGNEVADCHSLAISPDGKFVYVGREVSFWVPMGTVEVFRRDSVSGLLSHEQSLSVPASVRQIIASPDGLNLYLLDLSQILVLSRDVASGHVTLSYTYTNASDGLAALNGLSMEAMTGDGKGLYVGAGNTLWVFSRDSLTGALSVQETLQSSDVWGVVLSPDGMDVYSGTATQQYRRDPSTGSLTPGASYTGGPLGSAEAILVTPDGASVIVVTNHSTGNVRSYHINVFQRDLGTGVLTLLQTLPTQESGGLVQSPDGTSIYMISGDGPLIVFERDPSTGLLRERQAILGAEASAYGSDSVAVSADQLNVYATNYLSGTVRAYARDPLSGNLTDLQTVDGPALDGAAAVAISPDDGQVYVAAADVDTIANFSRAADGTLSLQQTLVNGAAGVEGIGGVRDLALSLDGASLYAAGPFDDALAVFARNPSNGQLTFLEVQRDGVGGVDSLAGCAAVAVSPDGNHVYAVADSDDAITAFQRDGTTGSLTMVQALHEGVGGVDGLAGASAVAISADGAYVYALGRQDQAVTTFSRDASTGQLAYVETLQPSPGSPSDISLSPKGDVALLPIPKGSVFANAKSFLPLYARDPSSGRLAFPPHLQWKSFSSSFDSLDGPFSAAWSGRYFYVNRGNEQLDVYEVVPDCGDAPRNGCFSPRHAVLALADSPKDKADRFAFKLLADESVLSSAFGDPINGTTNYWMCIYDASGTAFAAGVPDNTRCAKYPDPCWRPYFDNLIFSNRPGGLNGISMIHVRPGSAPIAFAKAKGKGINLPPLSSVPPLIPPVTAQLVNSDGSCWSATFQADQIRRNSVKTGEPYRFKAKQ